MSVLDQIQADVTTAMKAGDRERAGALRLVVSELQKARKEDAGADELAVLRRERKRRLESATQFRSAGRDELAAGEEREAELVAAYLPAELDDAELDRLVDGAIAETGANGPRDMGRVMKPVMAAVAGRADGRRVSSRVKERLGA